MAGEPLKLTLLGSGMPLPDSAGLGPATLAKAGGQPMLIEAGRGAAMRMFQLRSALAHARSDHLVGRPDLWLTGWLGGKFGRRTLPMRVRGPRGTRHLTADDRCPPCDRSCSPTDTEDILPSVRQGRPSGKSGRPGMHEFN